MGEWEPLADRTPVDVRRLATQLRRMKDRSGLTLPGLAARTAQSAEAWGAYLAAEKVPPLAAVEVLAQASGADYARVTALWKQARKAGGRGVGKRLPSPDPLDPLTAEEGLPARRGRFAALVALAVLAVAALLTVLLTAVPGTGRTPPPGAAPSPPPPTSQPPSHLHPEGPPRTTPPATPPPSPSPPQPSTPPPPTSTTPLPTRAPTPTTPSTPTAAFTSPPRTPPPTTPSGPPPATTPSTPTSTPLCLTVLVLGICLG